MDLHLLQGFSEEETELRPLRTLAAVLIQMKVQIRQEIGPRAHFRQKWKLFIKASGILVDKLMFAVILERHFALQVDKRTVNTKCHFLCVACRFTPREL